ncbi:hypothetical protein [Lapidilactobacillus luobeiensis]|uniref:hypothetical protein n=1 Tax=Lapidilactobacillus luobeiensis TaxID=2950371 RepID=UPI0021C33183|nr:hypothetical protein [Lapidilactobacillus luobeiensis]
MQIVIGVLAAILLLGIGGGIGHHYWLIHRQRQQQQLLDQQLRAALLPWQAKYPFIKFASLSSTVPVSIWHRDVLLFEYQVAVTPTHSLTITAAELTALLNQILKLPAPVHVTECWQLQQSFHFDVAYLANQATIRYMHDMDRIKVADQSAPPGPAKPTTPKKS